MQAMCFHEDSSRPRNDVDWADRVERSWSNRSARKRKNITVTFRSEIHLHSLHWHCRSMGDRSSDKSILRHRWCRLGGTVQQKVPPRTPFGCRTYIGIGGIDNRSQSSLFRRTGNIDWIQSSFAGEQRISRGSKKTKTAQSLTCFEKDPRFQWCFHWYKRTLSPTSATRSHRQRLWK